MPNPLDYRLKLVRVLAVLSGLYLTYLWLDMIRWNHDMLHRAVHLSGAAIFVAITLKAWRGSTRAGVVAALCSLTLIIPFTSFDHFLMVMALWSSPKGVYFYISSTAMASITWIILPIVTHRLTLRSTRTPPALPSALS